MRHERAACHLRSRNWFSSPRSLHESPELLLNHPHKRWRWILEDACISRLGWQGCFGYQSICAAPRAAREQDPLQKAGTKCNFQALPAKMCSPSAGKGGGVAGKLLTPAGRRAWEGGLASRGQLMRRKRNIQLPHRSVKRATGKQWVERASQRSAKQILHSPETRSSRVWRLSWKLSFLK